MVAPLYLIRLLTLKKRLDDGFLPRPIDVTKCTQVFVARHALTLMPLLGSSEEAQYDSGGSRIVVLMQVNAEGSPVIVDVEQAYLEVPVGVNIYSAAHFIRQTVGRG